MGAEVWFLVNGVERGDTCMWRTDVIEDLRVVSEMGGVARVREGIGHCPNGFLGLSVGLSLNDMTILFLLLVILLDETVSVRCIRTLTSCVA